MGIELARFERPDMRNAMRRVAAKKVSAGPDWSGRNGGLPPDVTPVNRKPGGATPATNPPTGDVARLPQKPPTPPPPGLLGPPMPPVAPSTQVMPLVPAPPPATEQERRRRRTGHGIVPPRAPVDLSVRQPPGQRDFQQT